MYDPEPPLQEANCSLIVRRLVRRQLDWAFRLKEDEPAPRRADVEDPGEAT